MILIGRMASPYVRRTAILLDLLGIEFEHKPLSAIVEQERLRRFNPIGRVPALQTEDGTLVDSTAIALTLLDTYDPDGIWLPKHGKPFAEALQVLFIANGAAERFTAAYYENRRRPENKVYRQWIDLCESQAISALDALERRVGSPFALGDALTYIDVAITTGLTFIANASERVFTAARHPRLEALRQKCESHDAFSRRPAT